MLLSTLGDLMQLMYLINTLLYFLEVIRDRGVIQKNLNVYFVVDVVTLEIFGFPQVGFASSTPLFAASELLTF